MPHCISDPILLANIASMYGSAVPCDIVTSLSQESLAIILWRTSRTPCHKHLKGHQYWSSSMVNALPDLLSSRPWRTGPKSRNDQLDPSIPHKFHPSCPCHIAPCIASCSESMQSTSQRHSSRTIPASRQMGTIWQPYPPAIRISPSLPANHHMPSVSHHWRDKEKTSEGKRANHQRMSREP